MKTNKIFTLEHCERYEGCYVVKAFKTKLDAEKAKRRLESREVPYDREDNARSRWSDRCMPDYLDYDYDRFYVISELKAGFKTNG